MMMPFDMLDADCHTDFDSLFSYPIDSIFDNMMTSRDVLMSTEDSLKKRLNRIHCMENSVNKHIKEQ